MNQAVRLKFRIQGLDRAAVDAILGEDFSEVDRQEGHLFSDGSRMILLMPDADSPNAGQYLIDCLDANGERPTSVVRSTLTCRYLGSDQGIDAYHNGVEDAKDFEPYFTFWDMEALAAQVTGVRVKHVQTPHRRHGIRFEHCFEILQPGYERGGHRTATPELLDLGLGDSVIVVYRVGFLNWDWKLFNPIAGDPAG